MQWSDYPAVNEAVWLWLFDSIRENPYRPPDMEVPPPMTRDDVIAAVPNMAKAQRSPCTFQFIDAMPIPTRRDEALAAIDEAHAVVVVRCRAFIHAGQRRDPATIKQALQAYCDAVVDLVNSQD